MENFRGSNFRSFVDNQPAAELLSPQNKHNYCIVFLSPWCVGPSVEVHVAGPPSAALLMHALMRPKLPALALLALALLAPTFCFGYIAYIIILCYFSL